MHHYPEKDVLNITSKTSIQEIEQFTGSKVNLILSADGIDQIPNGVDEIIIILPHYVGANSFIGTNLHLSHEYKYQVSTNLKEELLPDFLMDLDIISQANTDALRSYQNKLVLELKGPSFSQIKVLIDKKIEIEISLQFSESLCELLRQVTSAIRNFIVYQKENNPQLTNPGERKNQGEKNDTLAKTAENNGQQQRREKEVITNPGGNKRKRREKEKPVPKANPTEKRNDSVQNNAGKNQKNSQHQVGKKSKPNLLGETVVIPLKKTQASSVRPLIQSKVSNSSALPVSSTTRLTIPSDHFSTSPKRLLSDRFKKYEKLPNKMEEENSQLKQKLEVQSWKSEEESARKQEEINALRFSLAEAHRQLEEMADECGSYSETLKEEVENLDGLLEEEEDRLEEEKDRRRKWQNEATQLRDELEQKDVALDKEIERGIFWKEKSRELARQLERKSSEVDKTENEIAQLRKRLDLLKEANQAEKEALEKRLTSLIVDLGDLYIECYKLQEAKKTLEKALAEEQQTIKQQGEQYRLLQTGSEQKVRSQAEQIEELQRQNKDQKEKSETLLTEQRGLNDSQKKEIEELSKQNNALEAEVARLKGSIRFFSDRNSQLEEQNAKLVDTNHELVGKNKEQSATVDCVLSFFPYKQREEVVEAVKREWDSSRFPLRRSARNQPAPQAVFLSDGSVPNEEQTQEQTNNGARPKRRGNGKTK